VGKWHEKWYFYGKSVMNPLLKRIVFISVCATFCCLARAQQNISTNAIGLTLLQDLNTNLNGSGVRVGQAEAIDANGDWEVDPANVFQPVSLFTYYTNGGSSSTFPNSLGGESGHADVVGQIFYAPQYGIATNIAHVDNSEADYYFSDIVVADVTLPGGITDAVVNQSFTFGALDATDQETYDSYYDNYSTKFNTLFISAANNSGQVCEPGTSYDCISVGAYGGSSSVGPTIDNGRCKPDITAPQSETSFSTPQVGGSAAVLRQAGLRGDGGSATNCAANMITIKALLLNGAVKPADWSNSPPSPLDFRYGVGVLNIFNSYEQLAGGRHVYNFSTNIPTGTAHPPVVTTASIPALSGWDFNTNDSSSSKDSVNHYFFNATNGNNGVAFTLTATLVWNRHQNKTAINNLALFLYNAANSNLVASSTSVVDNVQHVFVPQLSQGRYDLQVWKAGGGSIASTNEWYALAWAMSPETLTITEWGTNVCLSWPAYPAGFTVAAASSLDPPVVWSTNNIPAPVFTNNQEVIWLSPASSAQFFQLQTPDF
jgi:Subtilase family